MKHPEDINIRVRVCNIFSWKSANAYTVEYIFIHDLLLRKNMMNEYALRLPWSEHIDLDTNVRVTDIKMCTLWYTGLAFLYVAVYKQFLRKWFMILKEAKEKVRNGWKKLELIITELF